MRLIDADALQKLFNEISTGLLGKAPYDKDIEHQVRAFLMVAEMIADAPTIDAEPVRHGYWKRIKYVEGDWMRCSACEENIWTAGEFAGLGCLGRFCPHCGAIMDEVSE